MMEEHIWRRSHTQRLPINKSLAGNQFRDAATIKTLKNPINTFKP